MKKEHLNLGKILLIAVTSVLLFNQCNKKYDQNTVYLYSGIKDSSYFEYVLLFEQDSIFSFVWDEDSGLHSGFSNSLAIFNKDGLVDTEMDIFLTSYENIDRVKLIVDGKELPILLDTFFSDVNYLHSIDYSVDYVIRKQNYLGEGRVQHLEYSTSNK